MSAAKKTTKPTDPSALIAKGRRFVYYIPEDAFIEGHGFRTHAVFESHPDLFASGTWPYTGAVGETMPWFWGMDLEGARTVAAQKNKEMGFTPEVVQQIISSSIGESIRDKGKAKGPVTKKAKAEDEKPAATKKPAKKSAAKAKQA